MKKRYLLPGILLSIVFFSCHKNQPQVKGDPLLEVNGKYLYPEDIRQIIPPSMNKRDSTEMAESYIRKWVTDVLMYENAQRNISDQKEIDELVENYRKSLIINEYQQKLVEQRLPANPSDEELNRFYNQYIDHFQLKENIVKGLLLVVPAKTNNLVTVRSWVVSSDTKALEKIEKYSLRNAISYDYFGNKWMPLSEVLKKIPVKVEDPTAFVKSNKLFETSDSLKHYFLRIESYKTPGETEPFELARDRIAYVLLNQQKNEFIKKFESDLYNDAIKDGTVIYFKRK